MGMSSFFIFGGGLSRTISTGDVLNLGDLRGEAMGVRRLVPMFLKDSGGVFSYELGDLVANSSFFFNTIYCPSLILP